MKIRWSRIQPRLVYWLFIFILSGLILYLFVQVSGVNHYYKARLGDMLYGTAYRPYVYRILLPALARGLAPAIPSGLVELLKQSLGVGQMLAHLDVVSYPAEALIILLGLYLSLPGFVYSLRSLMRALDYSEEMIDWIPAVALPLLIPTFLAGYIYDFPTLFLFTLGLAFLVRRQWLAYLGVFLLATLNKETAILLTMIYVLHYWRSLERIKFSRLLIGQLTIFGLVKVVLGWLFRNNPGGMIEYHLADQLSSIQSMPVVALTLLLILSGFAVWIARGWSSQPIFLRHALAIALPLGILYFFFGMPYELRVFLEVYPVILLLSVRRVPLHINTG